MRLGLVIHEGRGLESVRYVAKSLISAIGEEHELLVFPQWDYTLSNADEKLQRADAFVANCDVIVGFPSVLEPVLHARRRSAKSTPCIVITLGAFPRGALAIQRLIPYLSTEDIFVATSRADAQLSRRFISNPDVRLLPLSYDASNYRSATVAEREAARKALGFNATSAVLLYAGRISVEKNIHTLLRVFREVLRSRPDACLLLAGPLDDTPFLECGVYPIRYGRMLSQLAEALGIPPERVRRVGMVGSEQLRELYTASNILLNLTLHHDENFGLAQLEATACGTPVVGASWGGLQDTIHQGVNGYAVTTVVTPFGVKVDWCEAVSRILLVLDAQSRGAWSRSRTRSVCDSFSVAVFRQRWKDLLMYAQGKIGTTNEPVLASKFAERFWRVCAPSGAAHPVYTHGTESVDLYREMISEYASSSSDTDIEAPFSLDEMLVLPGAIQQGEDGWFQVHDPLYPFFGIAPPEHRHSGERILDVLHREPAIAVRDLFKVFDGETAALEASLRWLISQGLLLRSQPVLVSHRQWPAGGTAEILYSIARIDRNASGFLVYGDAPALSGAD